MMIVLLMRTIKLTIRVPIIMTGDDEIMQVMMLRKSTLIRANVLSERQIRLP